MPENIETSRRVHPFALYKRIAKIAGNVLFFCLMAVLAVLVVSLIQAGRNGGKPGIFGYTLYVVQSGSMSPTFDTGSLVIVRPADPETVKEGDIITFKDPRDGVTLVTHRVAAVSRDGGLSFTSKGDANEIADFDPVPAANLVGTVRGSIPFAGYVMNFARTPIGLVLLVIVPGVVVIFFEFRRLMICATELEKEKKAKKAEAEKQPSEPRP